METKYLLKNILALRILYPIWMILGAFHLMYMPSIIIIENDAVSTANNIIQNPLLFRLGIAAGLLSQILFIATVLFLYKIFEHINKNQSSLMVLLALVSVPVAMLSCLNLIAAQNLIDTPTQVMFYLHLNDQVIAIASIFWGLWLFPLGLLLIASKYFPKIIGACVIVGGIGYLLGSFVKLLLPDQKILLSIFETMTIGEVIFILYLLIKGPKISQTEYYK